MRVTSTIGTESVGIPSSPSAVVEAAAAAERQGFRSAWCTHFSRGIDSLTVLAAAATATTSIELGVGVIPTFPRHPVALAQSAATVQSLSGGRLVLGVGVSHRPVIEAMHGLDYSDQLGHMREYLTVLGGLLTDGAISFQGTHYRVDASIHIPAASAVPVVVGALAEGMSRVAGEFADGVTTWLAGPRSLEQVVVPAVTDGAVRAGRRDPRVVAAVPVAVDSDAARAAEAADRVFALYGTLANYQRLFEREGVDRPSQLAVVGSEETVTAGLGALFAAGATDVWAIPFDTGNGTDATQSLLARLAVS
ncbi:MAG: TIGR03564 family F420-dependent LLM class oxidoreductase [Acidimicrobiia bacterium]